MAKNLSKFEKNVEEYIASINEEYSLKLFGKHEVELGFQERNILNKFISTTRTMTNEERDKCIDIILHPEWKEHPKYYAKFASNGMAVIDSRNNANLPISYLDNYQRVHIKSKEDNQWHSIGLHHAIGELFVPNDDPEHKTQVHHIDGSRSCNWPWNLVWLTPSDHVRAHFEMGTRQRGEDSIFAHHTEEQIRHVCQLLQDRPDLTYAEISDITGVSPRSVAHINNGDTWTHVSREYKLKPRETNFKFGARGEQNGWAKFTVDQIKNVCEYLSDPKYAELTYKEIEGLTGVSMAVVYGISNGKSWKDVSKDYTFIPRDTDKRRGARGSNNQSAKYTESQVRHVCELLQDIYDGKYSMTHREIADKVGMKKQVVDNISAGSQWTCITKDYQWYKDKYGNR